MVGVFGQILDPEFENDISTFEETSMRAMRTQNPRMTLKVHMLIHNVPEYVRRTAAPLGHTSEQAPFLTLLKKNVLVYIGHCTFL